MTAYPPLDGTQPCADSDLDIWFPNDKADAPGALAEARSLCHTCTFYQPCRAFALAHHVDGIWAGTTPEMRRQQRRKLKIGTLPLELTDEERRRRRIKSLDDGSRTYAEIARELGCSERTVERYANRRRQAS